MKAGVSTACLYPVHVEDALQELGDMGIDNTEIFLNCHSELKESFIRNLSHILENNNMSCVSIHPFTSELDNLMFFSQYKRRIYDILEYHKYYFNAMNILGAEIFVFHGNKTSTPVNPEFYMERFNMLCELGRSFGITVAHENVARCQCRSIDFMKQLINLNPDIRFTLDIKQCIRAGENPINAAYELGSNIIHVHISDHNDKNDCMEIGKGSFDIEKFLAVLKEKGFDRSVVIELYRGGFEKDSDLYDSFRNLSDIIERI